MLRKYACIFGGNSDLGKHLIKKLKKKNLINRWKIFNVDYEANLDASDNFILGKLLIFYSMLSTYIFYRSKNVYI